MNFTTATSILVWGEAKEAANRNDPGYFHGQMIRKPTLLETLNGTITWIQVAFGEYHFAALSSNGEVHTWGDGSQGALGHGNSDDKSIPTRVEALSEMRIVKIACGWHFTAALSEDGKLFTWGNNSPGEVGLSGLSSVPKIVDALKDEVVVDIFPNVALTASGSLFSWGFSRFNGHSEESFIIRVPKIVRALETKHVISVSSSGSGHSACVTREGELFTWGTGYFGELGHGDVEDVLTPKLVESIRGVKCKQVSCGRCHTAVITENEKMYTFGLGKQGQLGHGSKDKMNKLIPTLVLALETKHIMQVQCGVSHTIALTSCGFVYMWGEIKNNMEDVVLRSAVPQLIQELRTQNVTEIFSGDGQCGVLVDSSPSLVRQALQSRFNDKDNSDVVFKLESDHQTIYADRNVLTSRSEYFEAMFQRSQMRESIEGVVSIPDECSSVVFLKLLEYICLEDFTFESIDTVEMVRELWDLADMYLLEGLKVLCEQKLAKHGGIK